MSWTKLKPFTDFIDIRRYTGHPGGKVDYKTRLESETIEGFSQAEGVLPKPKTLLDWNEYERDYEPCGIYFIRVKDESANDLTKSGYYDYIGKAAGNTSSRFQRGIFHRVYDHYRKLCCLPHREKFNTLIQKYHMDIEDKSRQKENKPKAIELLEEQNFSDIEELRVFFASPHLKNDGKDELRKTATTQEYGTTKNFLKVFQNCSKTKTNNLNTFAGIKEFFEKKVELAFLIIEREGKKNFPEEVAKAEGLALARYIQEYEETPYLNKNDEVKDFNTLPENI